MRIPAIHKATGFAGHVRDTMLDNRGRRIYYFQADWQPVPTPHGWMGSAKLAIPGVNAPVTDTVQP